MLFEADVNSERRISNEKSDGSFMETERNFIHEQQTPRPQCRRVDT